MMKLRNAVEVLFHRSYFLIEKIETLESQKGIVMALERVEVAALKRALFEMGIPESDLPVKALLTPEEAGKQLARRELVRAEKLKRTLARRSGAYNP